MSTTSQANEPSRSQERYISLSWIELKFEKITFFSFFQETQHMELPSFIKKVEGSTATSMETEQSARSSEAVSNTSPSNASVGSSSETENLSSMGSTVNNKPEDDGRVCKICYNGELGVVFLPCGHMFACVCCAPDMTTCAVCREPVIMTVRAFLS